ncbi:phosphoribosyltransferase family protein [Algoriphagus chordae]|uniref:Pyrimidine operon attenuation protein/uracil phosphoribosyltransferase n=1 Tax=Algoriphagus chordae TaxID=237019 RepID=A0A2W7T0M8_9BACT|nr:phosphoribosyltransferase family protein [Algoriphagus chordae]PZX56702.1 pyrimidine operon attenuation protein/uracil phosphoribosyltransferase [Algoriphagus chordae]
MSEVLNHQQIKKKITRMAYEIYERNLNSKAVVFAGISGMGRILADLLAAELRAISPLTIEQTEIMLDKTDIASGKVQLSKEIDLQGKSLILVDDVLNTGKTLVYAMKPFLGEELFRMEIAVLVNRSHGLFPIRPDYTGFELSTTLNEHIKVDFSGDNYFVYLH